jgi:hypothetical protein
LPGKNDSLTQVLLPSRLATSKLFLGDLDACIG